MNILLKYIYIQFIIAMLYLDDRNNVIYVCVKDGTLWHCKATFIQ